MSVNWARTHDTVFISCVFIEFVLMGLVKHRISMVRAGTAQHIRVVYYVTDWCSLVGNFLSMHGERNAKKSLASVWQVLMFHIIMHFLTNFFR